MPPLIGITVGASPGWSGRSPVLAEPYVAAVAAAGGRSVLLPPGGPAAGAAGAAAPAGAAGGAVAAGAPGPAVAAGAAGAAVAAGAAGAAVAAGAVLDGLDGLLLPGGGDIEAWRFGQSPHPRCGPPDPERDRREIGLCLAAQARGLPVLGVCRGIQVLNVALGGTLVQDLPAEWPGALQHRQAGPRDAAGHTVDVTPGSLLAALVGAGCLEVNSFHHQSVGALAPGLAAVARSADGVVEAVEGVGPGGGWLLGVQWHPEELWRRRPVHGRLFAALVEAAAARPGRGMA